MGEASDAATVGAAVRAVLALPTIAALVVPMVASALDPWTRGFWPWGLVVVIAGGLILVRTVVDFLTVGRGTLAPWDPPRRLVTTGLFGWCRNPMYVGVIAIVAGWAMTFRSPVVAGYTLVLAVVFHVRVVTFEEPWAERTFPGDWPAYRRCVPRWMPRLGRRNR